MVLEGVYDAFGGVELVYSKFSGVALVYFWGYELVSDIPVFLDYTLAFGADLVINNLEVDLVV